MDSWLKHVVGERTFLRVVVFTEVLLDLFDVDEAGALNTFVDSQLALVLLV